MARGPYRPDPYAVLGVQPSASARQITSAYRDLVRMLHPDTALEEPTVSAQRLGEVVAAYEILHDPARRAACDVARSAAPTSWTARSVPVPVVHVGSQPQGRRDVPHTVREWDRTGSLGTLLWAGPVRTQGVLPPPDDITSVLPRWLWQGDPWLP
ncbi:J domain-containing protein [Kitasatospora mediocidica]|uniref:J domain-containing protein n=1 Tax=Kitasatospora mediocidica TaxID=58352 RepID=UPI00056A34AD|nr:J domain-containing protein [Kitasatospora mediocidica]